MVSGNQIQAIRLSWKIISLLSQLANPFLDILNLGERGPDPLIKHPGHISHTLLTLQRVRKMVTHKTGLSGKQRPFPR